MPGWSPATYDAQWRAAPYVVHAAVRDDQYCKDNTALSVCQNWDNLNFIVQKWSDLTWHKIPEGVATSSLPEELLITFGSGAMCKVPDGDLAFGCDLVNSEDGGLPSLTLNEKGQIHVGAVFAKELQGGVYTPPPLNTGECASPTGSQCLDITTCEAEVDQIPSPVDPEPSPGGPPEEETGPPEEETGSPEEKSSSTEKKTGDSAGQEFCMFVQPEIMEGPGASAGSFMFQPVPVGGSVGDKLEKDIEIVCHTDSSEMACCGGGNEWGFPGGRTDAKSGTVEGVSSDAAVAGVTITCFSGDIKGSYTFGTTAPDPSKFKCEAATPPSNPSPVTSTSPAGSPGVGGPSAGDVEDETSSGFSGRTSSFIGLFSLFLAGLAQ